MSSTKQALTAANSLATVDTAPEPVKQARISKRLRQVVELLTTGECTTIKAASARVDMHPDYVCRELKKPQVQMFAARAARDSIARGVMRASARLNSLVDASSEHVSLDATKHVLGLAGIKVSNDAQVSVNIDIKAGYVIDLSDVVPGNSGPHANNIKVIDGKAG